MGKARKSLSGSAKTSSTARKSQSGATGGGGCEALHQGRDLLLLASALWHHLIARCPLRQQPLHYSRLPMQKSAEHAREACHGEAWAEGGTYKLLPTCARSTQL